MQIHTILKSVIAAGVLSLGAMAADAATITFNFNAGSTASVYKSGLHVDLGVAEFNVSGSPKVLTASTGSLTANAGGLGVALGGGSSKVDSILNKREAVTFNFSKFVTVSNVTFTDQTGGKFLLFRNGTADGTSDAFSLASSVALLPPYAGTYFGIGAKTGDSFYISSVTVETPVPVPAAGLLLGSVALVPMLRRRKRA